jgi:hypothetical protein
MVAIASVHYVEPLWLFGFAVVRSLRSAVPNVPRALRVMAAGASSGISGMSNINLMNINLDGGRQRLQKAIDGVGGLMARVATGMAGHSSQGHGHGHASARLSNTSTTSAVAATEGGATIAAPRMG